MTTPTKSLIVTSGSRLHFGLMELSTCQPKCFAGFGVMVEDPQFCLELTGRVDVGNAEFGSGFTIEADASVKRRIEGVFANFLNEGVIRYLPERLRVLRSLPLHSGLGAGTQLACGVAQALLHFSDSAQGDRSDGDRSGAEDRGQFSSLDAERLCALSGRGLRSAIGVQGALTGGLVLDQGYPPTEAADIRGDAVLPSRRIETQWKAPQHDWRVLILLPKRQKTIAGESEAAMIDSVAQQANPHFELMWSIARELMTRIDEVEVSEFGQKLDEYMELAGGLFRGLQGGLYVSDSVREAVAAARDAGLHGVGQSSWGPAVFGFAADAEQAEWSLDRLRSRLAGNECELLSTKVAREGTRLDWK